MSERLSHIARWQSSGKTQKAYCAEYGLVYSTFCAWRKKDKTHSGRSANGFVALHTDVSPRVEISLGDIQVKIFE